MPHDPIPAVPRHRAEIVTQALGGLRGTERLAAALAHPLLGQTAMVSSFGADSVVLLHQLSQIAPSTPVLFLDTQMLFPETLDYQRRLAGDLGLTGIRTIRARAVELAQADPANLLHRTDTDACCALRKTGPLQRALRGFDSWITGRKRFQSGSRAALPLVEESEGKLKLNPLADWSAAEIAAYIDSHHLPRHPLVARGYPSIGCAPCTEPVAEGEDPRAGRWRGQDKIECGIHFVDGRAVRSGRAAQ